MAVRSKWIPAYPYLQIIFIITSQKQRYYHKQLEAINQDLKAQTAIKLADVSITFEENKGKDHFPYTHLDTLADSVLIIVRVTS